ncbi:hypothetical protein Bbelb_339380 [Branchiostoma belcheri]|nr:hypothetical protein Bbelb_339380 [Branchiostoma belcheri]
MKIPKVHRFPRRPTEPSRAASLFRNSLLVDIFEKPCGKSVRTIPQDLLSADKLFNCQTPPGQSFKRACSDVRSAHMHHLRLNVSHLKDISVVSRLYDVVCPSYVFV